MSPILGDKNTLRVFGNKILEKTRGQRKREITVRMEKITQRVA
jgi:hypothetical protein